jgi:integrase
MGDYILHDGKTTSATGEKEMIALSPQALNILALLPKRADGKVFGLMSIRHLWVTLTQDAGIAGLRIQDMRRTFSTFGVSESEVDFDTVQKLLNHKSATTTARYARLMPTARVNAATKIGNTLDKLHKIPEEKR